MTDYDKVQAGERVKAFLHDEYVKRVLVRLEENALRRFKQAKNDEELREAQAIARVTDAFVGLLLQMVEEGELAKTA